MLLLISVLLKKEEHILSLIIIYILFEEHRYTLRRIRKFLLNFFDLVHYHVIGDET
jgi:hypothetical protein